MAVSFSRTTRTLDADQGKIAQQIGFYVLLVLIAGWALWFFLGKVSVYEVSSAARIEVASSARDVSVEEGGKLLASRLAIGRVVKAGEVLAQFDDAPQKLRLAEAEARLAGFPGRIAALKRQEAAASSAMAGSERAGAAAIAAARARARGADADAAFIDEMAERRRIDSESGGIAPIEASRAAAEARKAGANRDAVAKEQQGVAGDTQSVNSARMADAASVTAVLAQTASEWVATQMLVEQLRHELRARQIRAPVDGVIGDVATLHLGEILAAGVRLATIVPQEELRIVATFDASQGIGRLNEGQTARLRLDGFSWTQYGDFPARVQRVAAEANGQALRVELQMPRRLGTGLPLRHGMTGHVDVMIEEVSPAILLLRTLGQAIA